jgi:hypothetical protein
MRKLLISLWWSIGRWLLQESSDSPLPDCLGPRRSCHIDLNDASPWLDSHPDVMLTNAQQRPLMHAEAFWLLTPLDKTLFFSWLWSIYGTERLKEEYNRMTQCSEHESVVLGIEPLARAFGFQTPDITPSTRVDRDWGRRPPLPNELPGNLKYLTSPKEAYARGELPLHQYVGSSRREQNEFIERGGCLPDRRPCMGGCGHSDHEAGRCEGGSLPCDCTFNTTYLKPIGVCRRTRGRTS